MSEEVILYGIIPWSRANWLQNHIILLYKQFLFQNRDRPNNLALCKFQAELNQIEVIEYRIASKRDRMFTHLQKWEKYKTHAIND